MLCPSFILIYRSFTFWVVCNIIRTNTQIYDKIWKFKSKDNSKFGKKNFCSGLEENFKTDEISYVAQFDSRSYNSVEAVTKPIFGGSIFIRIPLDADVSLSLLRGCLSFAHVHPLVAALYKFLGVWATIYTKKLESVKDGDEKTTYFLHQELLD